MLNIIDLHVSFPLPRQQELLAVRGASLRVGPSEILGLVGESGSGKSVTAFAVLQLVPLPGRVQSGQILFKGKDLVKATEREMLRVRGSQIAMIFQNPQASLNPAIPVGRQVSAIIRMHREMSRQEAKAEVLHLFETVGIPEAQRCSLALPSELSGGLCQRVMIAMALGCRPSLLIADEPTSSLDVTIQAQILDLLIDLRERFQMAILLISHDLGVVAEVCDRVAVMQRGQIVEEGSAIDVYAAPKHPYTRLLLDSVPVADPTRRRRAGRAVVAVADSVMS